MSGKRIEISGGEEKQVQPGECSWTEPTPLIGVFNGRVVRLDLIRFNVKDPTPPPNEPEADAPTIIGD
jgi:hypothetical protein